MPGSEDCDAVIPIDEVRLITATPDAQAMVGAGGWSEWGRGHAPRGCRGLRLGRRRPQPGGEGGLASPGRWAYLRMLNAGTSTPIGLAGLASGDAASVRCDDRFGTTCAVDLTVGRDRYNVTANDQATAIALAEALLARLSG